MSCAAAVTQPSCSELPKREPRSPAPCSFRRFVTPKNTNVIAISSHYPRPRCASWDKWGIFIGNRKSNHKSLLLLPCITKGFAAVHQLFAALLSLLLSFGHHSAASHPLEASITYDHAKPNPALTFPDRQDLDRTASVPDYAGSACLSCRTMSVSFIAR